MAHSPLLPCLDSAPYLKFQVTNRFNPVPLPRNQVPYRLRDSISLGEWRAFWFGLEPIRQQNRRWDLLSGWGKPLVWMVYFVLLFRSDWNTTDHESLKLLMFWSSLSMLVACLNVSSTAIKNTEVRPLQIACCAAEDQLFRRHGWVLDCDYKANLCGCCISETIVYFIPVADRTNANRNVDLGGRNGGKSIEREDLLARNGYLRIELFKDGFYSWNPMSIAHIESFETLPAHLMSRDGQCWGPFWSKLLEQSKRHLLIYHCTVIFNWPMYPFLVIHTCLVENGVWTDSSLDNLSWLMIGSFWASSFFVGILMSDTQTLLREYTKELAQEGLLLESRVAPVSDSSWDGDAIYLYLYPRNTVNDNTAQSSHNNASGSISQRVGSRNNYADAA
jgi:hypothetical protein